MPPAAPQPADAGWATIRFEANKKAMVGSAGFKIRVDGEVVGFLSPDGSMVHRVRPGEIRIEVKRMRLERWRLLTVRLGPGETAHVYVSFLRATSGKWSMELRSIG